MTAGRPKNLRIFPTTGKYLTCYDRMANAKPNRWFVVGEFATDKEAKLFILNLSFKLPSTDVRV